MAYTISITYLAPSKAADSTTVCSVCGCYVPGNSYVDTSAYEGTIYDTNTTGNGAIALLEPYATESCPFPVSMAQFKMAVVGALDSDTGAYTTSFEVDDYKEAFYYKELAVVLADEGFTITVTKSES